MRGHGKGKPNMHAAGIAFDRCIDEPFDPGEIHDFIEHAVAWKGGSLAALAGKAVRLRFLLEDAELFSMKFGA